MKNIGHHLFENLRSEGVNVTLMGLKNVAGYAFWRRIRRFNPDIVHLIPGPSTRGLIFLRLVSLLTGGTSIATATQPRIDRLQPPVSDYLRPEVLLVQSPADEARYTEFGFNTRLLPLCGVDLEKFSPVSAARRRQLRRELRLPQNDPVFLHVGPLTRERNLTVLVPFTERGKLLVVSSPGTDTDPTVVDHLRESGCLVRIEYRPDVEKYFQAADVYLFPVEREDASIRIPLTVLEAMACNLPVVTTRYGGIPGLFDEGGGLRYTSFGSEAAYQAAVDYGTMRRPTERLSLRERVRNQSWSAITDRLLDLYRDALRQ